jgi:hypothetical protein
MKMGKIAKAGGFILAILFGIFMWVYGGYDDSPGGQGLGLLVAVFGVWGLARMRRVA